VRAQPGPRLACGKPGLQITSISDASPHATMLHIDFLPVKSKKNFAKSKFVYTFAEQNRQLKSFKDNKPLRRAERQHT
jgi:hypothetical protein